MDELHEDPTMIVRTFNAEITPGAERTADVRIVPFGVLGKADDGLGGLPRGVVYDEEWLPGAFDHQMNAAHRMTANVEHEQGVSGIVGRGLALRAGSDGYYGSFKFLDTPNGETARQLVESGTFGHVSLEARPVKSRRAANGVVQRMKANLVGIAFCRVPAFAGADVLSLREGQEEESEIVWDEALMLPPANSEVLARVAALGIKIPEGLGYEPEAPSEDE